MGDAGDRRRGRRPRPAAGLRYPRLIAAGSALAVTFVAVLGGIGGLPTGRSRAQARPRAEYPGGGRARLSDAPPTPPPASTSALHSGPVTLPAHTGTGRRIV